MRRASALGSGRVSMTNRASRTALGSVRRSKRLEYTCVLGAESTQRDRIGVGRGRTGSCARDLPSLCEVSAGRGPFSGAAGRSSRSRRPGRAGSPHRRPAAPHSPGSAAHRRRSGATAERLLRPRARLEGTRRQKAWVLHGSVAALRIASIHDDTAHLFFFRALYTRTDVLVNATGSACPGRGTGALRCSRGLAPPPRAADLGAGVRGLERLPPGSRACPRPPRAVRGRATGGPLAAAHPSAAANSGSAPSPMPRAVHNARRRSRPREPKASARARVSRAARPTPARRRTASMSRYPRPAPATPRPASPDATPLP